MRLKEYIKKMPKEEAYSRYWMYLDAEAKDYSRITRSKMADEIIETISESPELIYEICTSDELEMLEALFSGKEVTEDKKKLRDLSRTSLLVETGDCEFEIPEELVEAVKSALHEVNWEEMRSHDRDKEVLLGLLKTHVVLPWVSLDMMANQIYEIEEADIAYIRRYSVLQMDGDHECYVYAPFSFWFYEIRYAMMEHNPYQQFFDEETLITIAKYDADIRNEKIKRAIELINNCEYPEIAAHYWNQIQQAVHILNKKELDYLSTRLIHLFSKEETASIMEAAEELHSAALNGASMKMYAQQMEDEKRVKELNAPIVQSSRLAEQEIASFYKLYLGLLEYVNQKYGVVKGAKFYRSRMVLPKHQMAVREKLFENVKIIDEFVERNPFGFNRRELAAVRDFKYALYGRFVIVKYEKSFTIFKEESEESTAYYGVKSLYSNFSEMLRNYELPLVVETALIPFANRIVADGILNLLPMRMSARMALRYLKEMEEGELLKQLPITQGETA